MKLGIIFLVIGIVLLILAIPLSILGIMAGVAQAAQGKVGGGISSYLLVIGVIIGFVLTVIGAIRIYFKK